MAEIRALAQARYEAGPVNPLVSGKDPLHNEVVGLMAEMAVCCYYGVGDEQVRTVYAIRPGAIPDLTMHGLTISVKATEYWHEPLHLIIPERDLGKDAYILVSVNVAGKYAGLRGWIDHRRLVAYPLTNTTLNGRREAGKAWRHVPLSGLRECRLTGVNNERRVTTVSGR